MMAYKLARLFFASIAIFILKRHRILAERLFVVQDGPQEKQSLQEENLSRIKLLLGILGGSFATYLGLIALNAF